MAAFIELAQNLGIGTIAEWVQSEADAEFLLRDDAISAWHGDVAMIVAYGC